MFGEIVLTTGWMLAMVPGGIAAVGPEMEISIEIEDGTPASSWLDDPESRKRLRTVLDQHGALGESPGSDGRPLTAAIESNQRGELCHGLIVTADEALFLPPGISLKDQDQALNAFVAGLLPEGRLQGYAQIASGNGWVLGDQPDPGLLTERLLALEGKRSLDQVAVLDLRTGRLWEVAPGRLDRIGAAESHRLGPIRLSGTPVPLDPSEPDGLQVCIAQIAMPNLSVRSDTLDRVVQGVGNSEDARLKAHAEGAERFCGSRHSTARLVRSRQTDLSGSISPDRFHSRTLPVDGAESMDGERTWAAVQAFDGNSRWVPAEVAHLSLAATTDPELILPWNSSGLAAHLDPARAKAHAFAELVERDAFMWTWLRQVSRERIALPGIPAASIHLRDVALRGGWETTWVNISLETFPVILCCLTHPVKGLTLGSACRSDPAEALFRSIEEALVLALRFDSCTERIAAQEVRTPRDHLVFHRDPDRLADNGFLFSGSEEIGMSEILPGEGNLEALLDDLGFSPMNIDLSLELCQPFSVIRALAPGLLPITFGYGREPDGLPRASRDLSTRDGRIIGGASTDSRRTKVPHPFA